MIARELEIALHAAFVNARDHRHRFIGVEHLLLALLDSPTATQVLTACGADMSELRKKLTECIAAETPRGDAGEEVDTQPSLGFQRVIQRAILKVQSSGKKEVAGADVLVAMFGEKDSRAVHLLEQQRIGWLEAVNYISHGIKPGQSQQGGDNEQLGPSAGDGNLQVVLYNDDFTPMEFVVRVLEEFFGMSREDATEAMLEIHREGVAVCGLYSRQAGEEIVKQVLAHAAQHGYPLRCATVIPK